MRFAPPIVVGILIAHRPSVQDNLRGMVALRLQKQGVHVRMAGNACGLRLYGLRTSYLQSVGRGITVQRHILRLEGCWVIAILTEDTAKSSSNDALSHIAARPCKHYRVQLIHTKFAIIP